MTWSIQLKHDEAGHCALCCLYPCLKLRYVRAAILALNEHMSSEGEIRMSRCSQYRYAISPNPGEEVSRM